MHPTYETNKLLKTCIPIKLIFCTFYPHLTKIRVPDPPLVFVKSIFSIYLGDQITPSLTYQTIIKNFLFKIKMLYLASLQKLKSNTSNSVRLLTCYFTPDKLSIFKISSMSECFKVHPHKALIVLDYLCNNALVLNNTPSNLMRSH